MTHNRGYTLVELLAVLAILSILAMGVAPLAELATQRRKEEALRQSLWQIRSALDAYKRAVDNGVIARPPGGSSYPPNLDSLVRGVPDMQGRAVYFLRRLPRDPFAEDQTPAADTWLLRSYDSPPDAPRPGADVFDVLSRSDRIGTDGVPLREW